MAVNGTLSVSMDTSLVAAVVIPIGPGQETALDTLDSVRHYCPEPHIVVIIEDCTTDGTYDALLKNKGQNWFIFRNKSRLGIRRLVHSLSNAYRFVLQRSSCKLILRLDQDALLIKSGVIGDALAFSNANPEVGMFGVYEQDYNRPRSYDAHRRLMDVETRWYKKMFGLAASWVPLLDLAESRGYKRGDNVFGGAYFITRNCLEKIDMLGGLDPPYFWHSRLMEDVYFSMATVACGFNLGHFAAPDGPLCLEWRGLPYQARVLAESHFKLIHSVDKGPNTDRQANGGMTAREVFSCIRNSEKVSPCES